MHTLRELMEQAASRQLSEVAGREVSKDEAKRLSETGALLKELLNTDLNKKVLPKIDMKETLRSPDVSIMFPRVMSDVMLKAKEPNMIGQSLLMRTVRIDATRSFEFPALGAIKAFDVPEGGEYREQHPGVTKHRTDIKTNRAGVLLSVSEDVIKDSQWDVLGLYLEAAGHAMVRHKEQKIFEEFEAHLHPVYDNASADSDLWTNGHDRAQARNYTIAFDDMLDLFGAVVMNEYIPTDMIMHPLSWVIMAKNPVIRNVAFTGGQIGQTIWSQIPQQDQNMNMPWNISYALSPFVPFSYNTRVASGPASGTSFATCNISSIYVVERGKAGVVLQREEMSMEENTDFLRDCQRLKLRERYGVATLDEGRAGASAKNIRLVQDFTPIEAVYSVTPA